LGALVNQKVVQKLRQGSKDAKVPLYRRRTVSHIAFAICGKEEAGLRWHGIQMKMNGK
jgi:hypothetical protein